MGSIDFVLRLVAARACRCEGGMIQMEYTP